MKKRIILSALCSIGLTFSLYPMEEGATVTIKLKDGEAKLRKAQFYDLASVASEGIKEMMIL